VARPQYAITILMDYDAHTLSVSQDTYYPNATGQSLGSLLLAVNPNLWSGVFNLQSITVNNQPHSDYSLAGQNLTINLPVALAPGETVKIGMAYTLTLPYASSKFENFGYTARQTNLTDWFPFVVPFLNGQWVLREPWAFGENLVYDKADFFIELGFANPDAIPVVAASAPAEATDAGFRYTLPNARTFALSMSREFLYSSQTTASGATVTSYYYPEDANAGAAILVHTAQAIDTYTNAFGPYPHSTLAVVETDLNDGLESDGLYFLARSFYKSYDGTPQNNLTVIGIHETAHQWWFGAVASDQAEEPWLDEALSCYAEHIYYETNYPGLVNWWWNWRVNYYSPTGYVDTRIYNPPTFRAYVNAVYLNGANFFDALRLRIGDEAFFNFFRAYYAQNNGRIVTASDFFNALAANASGYDDIVDAYFQNR
jgi:aminopeptidase N